MSSFRVSEIRSNLSRDEILQNKGILIRNEHYHLSGPHDISCNATY